MIGYSCKYAPVELVAAYGEEALLLDAETSDFSRAETLTHANVCCHAKALLTQALDTDELVLTDCCDATRRVCDVLQDAGRQRFLFQFDLPHDDAACARARLTRELIRFADAYGAYTGRAFSKEAFFAACRNHSSAHPPREPFIAVLGARVSPQLLGQIRCAFPIPVENLTCSGLRTLEDPPEEAAGFSFEALMDWYAGALLRQTPCMRMTDIASRRALYENENIRGIVYNTVKFCDYYGFEYADLKAKSAAALLKIESDYTLTAPGQLSTRLEAFRERLGLTAPDGGAGNQPPAAEKAARKKYFAGIDSGSTTTNMVVLNENEAMLAFAIVRTGPRAHVGAQAALETVCRTLHIEPDALSAIVATGYGRNNIPFATRTKTEITCHARAEPRRPHHHRHRRAGQQGHQPRRNRPCFRLYDERQMRRRNGAVSGNDGAHARAGYGGDEPPRPDVGKGADHFQHVHSVRRIGGDFADRRQPYGQRYHPRAEPIHRWEDGRHGRARQGTAALYDDRRRRAEPGRCAGAGGEAGRKALHQRKPGSLRRARRGALRPARRLILLAPRAQ